MKVVGKFFFVLHRDPSLKWDEVPTTISIELRKWLDRKGTIDTQKGTLRFKDGRVAELRTSEVTSEAGRALAWDLTEPRNDGAFTTRIRLAVGEDVATFSCSLSAGVAEGLIAPIFVEARCPRVVRNVLGLNYPWMYGETPVRCRPILLYGRAGGKECTDLIKAPSRLLPIVVVSQQEGTLIHPRITEQFAVDLAGIGIVAEIDDEAAWTVTKALGKDWSCYRGAIRLYWPQPDLKGNPFLHPVWTANKLMSNVTDTSGASQRIRNLIRRRILALSAFAVESPDLFGDVEKTARESERQARIQQSRDSEDYQQLAEEYARDNECLKYEISQIKEINAELKRDLYNAQLRLGWKEDSTVIEPEKEAPIETLEEAVTRARSEFAGRLSFGPQVDEGIAGVDTNAGPPEKVLTYLEKLAELAALKAQNRIGKSIANWLSQNGVDASQESKTIRRNGKEMAKRTWNDGSAPRKFEFHLKPSEATSPDRCVRIYYDWDDSRKQFIVGWIGRHP